ncbi:nitroreductase family protein [Paenibacillus puerhi]|uniref:nitroreductase family protein n=1 Tax=Paenibacillus puerhi TaxID=2692622 RepID=UPI001F196C57|nr:nitroreductase [Paenibacillus puerhi]
MNLTLPKGTVTEVIKERRTIKKFKPDPIPMETVTELLNIAAWAPNHGLREPWRFIAFKEEGKERLTEALSSFLIEVRKMDAEAVMKRMDYFLSIPLLLLVVVPYREKVLERDEDYAAASALIQNLQLAAWERDIGVLWRTNPALYAEEVKEKLGVAAEERIIGLLQIGYPEVIPPAQGRTAAETLLTVVDSR